MKSFVRIIILFEFCKVVEIEEIDRNNNNIKPKNYSKPRNRKYIPNIDQYPNINQYPNIINYQNTIYYSNPNYHYRQYESIINMQYQNPYMTSQPFNPNYILIRNISMTSTPFNCQTMYILTNPIIINIPMTTQGFNNPIRQGINNQMTMQEVNLQMTSQGINNPTSQTINNPTSQGINLQITNSEKTDKEHRNFEMNKTKFTNSSKFNKNQKKISKSKTTPLNSKTKIIPQKYRTIDICRNYEIKNFLNNISVDLKNFLSKNNFIDKKMLQKIILNSEEFDSIFENKNLLTDKYFISLFGYRFIPDICRKTGFYKNCESKIYNFSGYYSSVEFTNVLNRIKNDVYISFLEKLSIDSLVNLIKKPQKNEEILNFNVRNKFLVISQNRLSFEDIGLITKLYEKIKNFNDFYDKSIIIYVTEKNSDGYNILEQDDSNFYIRFSINNQNNSDQKPELIEISGFRNSKFLREVENIFYNFYYREIYNGFSFFINTTILSLTLKKNMFGWKSKTFSLKVKNNITSVKYNFTLKFKTPNILKILYNGKKLVIHENIIKNLINSIYGLHENPLSDINIMALRSFLDEPIFYFPKIKTANCISWCSHYLDEWSLHIRQCVEELIKLENKYKNINFYVLKSSYEKGLEMKMLLYNFYSKNLFFKDLNMLNTISKDDNDFIIYIEENDSDIKFKLYVFFTNKQNIFYACNFPFYSDLQTMILKRIAEHFSCENC
ncbi:hypothetical protein DMUE_2272 [Dictyocoela muelleri]|nr:hypothetical protein DMUE_2272 [Dictyocoela muelleri]